MKTRTQCLVPGVIAALIIPLSVHAADPPRCNEVFNDAQRLGCYDAVFGKPAAANKTAAPVAPIAPAAVTAPPPATSAAAPAAAAAVAVSPSVANAGLPATSKAAKPVKFNSSVTTVSHAADGRFVATLENGQKWLQVEREQGVDVKEGEAVTLNPMMFGSWSMGTKSGYMVRVRRLD